MAVCKGGVIASHRPRPANPWMVRCVCSYQETRKARLGISPWCSCNFMISICLTRGKRIFLDFMLHEPVLLN